MNQPTPRKRERGLRQSAAQPVALGLSIGLLACQSKVEFFDLNDEQREQVEEVAEFTQGEALQCVEGLIQRGDHWFASEGLPVPRALMMKQTQHTVELVSRMFELRRIKGFHDEEAYPEGIARGDSSPRRNSIGVPVEKDGSVTCTTKILAHEGAHFDTVRDRLRLNHGHSLQLEKARREDSKELAAIIHDTKDYPHLLGTLFTIPDVMKEAADTEISFIMTSARNMLNITKQEQSHAAETYTPQEVYEYILEQQRNMGSNPQEWIEFQFGLRRQRVLIEYNDGTGMVDWGGSIPIARFAIPDLNFYDLTQEDTIASILESGLWEVREQTWGQALKEFIASFPDEAIETAEETKRAPQEFRPQPRTRLR